MVMEILWNYKEYRWCLIIDNGDFKMDDTMAIMVLSLTFRFFKISNVFLGIVPLAPNMSPMTFHVFMLYCLPLWSDNSNVSITYASVLS